jgi:hypothetical protein
MRLNLEDIEGKVSLKAVAGHYSVEIHYYDPSHCSLCLPLGESFRAEP